MDSTRTTLVVLAPALVAYLLPLAIPLSGPGLSWLRLAAIVWALLGIIIALDPAWTERITKMRQGLDLLRNATPTMAADSNPVRAGQEEPNPPTKEAQLRPITHPQDARITRHRP
jgi:hypothetical protein